MTETPRDPTTPSDPVSLLVGAIAAQVIGGLITQMSPFVIDGLMYGLSLSERDAGFVGSVEFLTLAVTAIAVAPVLPRLSCRRIGFVAVALALLADGASIFSSSWVWFALLRGFAGVGEGALYAVSLCVVASRSTNPDRVYGYFQVVWALGSVALFSLGGELTAAFAYRGILALIACVSLALAPLLLFIPDARANSGEGAAADAPQVSPLLGVMTLAAIVLYLSVSDAVYAFSAPLGERAGLDTRAVGYTLTVGSVVGLVGAGAATAINVRWGRVIPVSGFCVGFSLVVLVLCLSHNSTAYVVALAASFIIFYFSIPYLFGLAAALDRRGRWAAAAGSAYLLGFAAGPAMAGALIGAGGYSSLAVVCVAITFAVWGLAMVVNRRLSRTARASPAAGALEAAQPQPDGF
jgi:predicted MFS family arabinose efflux permease